MLLIAMMAPPRPAISLILHGERDLLSRRTALSDKEALSEAEARFMDGELKDFNLWQGERCVCMRPGHCCGRLGAGAIPERRSASPASRPARVLFSVTGNAGSMLVDTHDGCIDHLAAPS